MALLVTRPYMQSMAMSDLLSREEVSSFIEPMLEISPLSYNKAIFNNSKALAVTSLNASSCVAREHGIDKKIPIFSVGAATSHPLKEAGFKNIIEAQGDAISLLQLIKDQYDPSLGLITYLSGQHITQDLARHLVLYGYNAERIAIYRANLVNQLSPDLIKRIRSRKIEAALFMSSRTASNFIRLCDDAGLSSYFKNMRAFVISKNVADCLKKTQWRRIITAKKPSQESVVREIKKYQSNHLNECQERHIK